MASRPNLTPGPEREGGINFNTRTLPELQSLPRHRPHPSPTISFGTPRVNRRISPLPSPPPPCRFETMNYEIIAPPTDTDTADPTGYVREPSPDWRFPVNDTYFRRNLDAGRMTTDEEYELDRIAIKAAAIRRANARYHESKVRIWRQGVRKGETFEHFWNCVHAYRAAKIARAANNHEEVAKSTMKSERTLSEMFAKKMDLGSKDEREKRIAENRKEEERCEAEENAEAKEEGGSDMVVEKHDVNMQDE